MNEKNKEKIVALGIYLIVYVFLITSLSETFIGSDFNILLNFIGIGILAFAILLVSALIYFFFLYLIQKFIKNDISEKEVELTHFILVGLLATITVWIFISHHHTTTKERLLNCLSDEEWQLKEKQNEIEDINSLIDYCYMILEKP